MTVERQVASLLADDALGSAVGLAAGHVKSNPQDHRARLLLIDLLVLSGEYERADRQAGLAATLAPQDVIGLALLRGQLRGMAARRAWFDEAAAPSFPTGPTPCDQAALKLNLAIRDGDAQAAAEALGALETARGERPAMFNGERVSDLRDLDDRLPHALEAITTGGSYLWIDFALIRSVAFEPMTRPRDLAFRRARIDLTDGATSEVLVPAIYPADADVTEALALGRATEWVDAPGGAVIGRGQRCFLAGDDLRSIMDAEAIALEPAMASTDG